MSRVKPIERVDDSRNRMRQMLDAAWGVYIKMEPKQRDSWRDKTLGDIIAHMQHEVQEVVKPNTYERKLHNALDLCGLGALIAAKCQLLIEEKLSTYVPK